MGLFFYTKIGSIIFIGDLPTTNIIEPDFIRRAIFLFRGQKRGKTFQDSSFTNKYDSANIIENDGKKGEFMIYFNVGPF